MACVNGAHFRRMRNRTNDWVAKAVSYVDTVSAVLPTMREPESVSLLAMLRCTVSALLGGLMRISAGVLYAGMAYA
jgi:hypothetical protein